MSEVDSQILPSTPADRDAFSDTSSRAATPHGVHEALDPSPAEPLEDETSPEEAVSADGPVIENASGTIPIIDTQADSMPAVQDSVDAPAEGTVKEKTDKAKPIAITKPKPSMSMKVPSSKSNGGPPTPLVKRIINSGTFGAGSIKAVSSKPTATTTPSATAKPTAPVLKPSISSSSAISSKPAMASSRGPAPNVAPPTRRMSTVPLKPTAPVPTKSLSSSTNTKPATTTTPPATTRASVISPAGSNGSVTSAARPRASVSEGVKRAPLASRQSLSSLTKPPTPTLTPSKPPLTRAPTKPTRTTTSISSIREVKEDGKVLEDLQNKLKDTADSLSAKTDAIAELEGQIDGLQSTLKSALADVESKSSLTSQLEEAKVALEVQLEEARDALENVQSEHRDGNTALESMQQELKAANMATVRQEELVNKLREQVLVLEGQVTTANEDLNALRISHSSTSSEAANIVSVERDALLQAQAALKSAEAAKEALTMDHAQVLKAINAQLAETESKAVRVEALEAQVVELKAGREDNASKLSELEIEILELKESQEVIEDGRDKLSATIKALEQELSNAVAATEQARQDAGTRAAEHAAQVEEAAKAHDQELQSAADEQAKLVGLLDALKVELSDALAAHEQSKVDAQAAAEEYARKIEEVEQGHFTEQARLAEEIKLITIELQGQESQYNAKVDAVKTEHTQLLQEAFERAKNEAAEVHSQELQTLRAGSNVTIEQIQAANQLALEDLKAEHASALESQVKGLEKQIGNLNVNLKATQDDLTKAKAALEVARAEIVSLTAYRDEARAAAAAAPDSSPEHIAEVDRLTKELSNTKDDLAAVSDMLNFTKASLTEMSNNHMTELEEAAKGRAEEVTRLRTAHDREVSSLAAQKSELLIKLSDLEGELATVKASISEPIAPRSNGAAHPPSPGVTKEELQRLYEAHNLKVHDLQADHDKAIKALRDELETSRIKADELQQEVARKVMEIEYLEQDQDESLEQITRLKEDLEHLSERIPKEHTVSA